MDQSALNSILESILSQRKNFPLVLLLFCLTFWISHYTAIFKFVFYLFIGYTGSSLLNRFFSLVAESRGYTLVVVCRLLIMVASLVAEHGHQAYGLADGLWHSGLASPQLMESSGTGDQTHVPCIGRQILNCWTTREVQVLVTEGVLGPEFSFHLECANSGFTQPISEVVNEGINNSPADVRRRLYKIFLSGGSTIFKDFAHHLQIDLKRTIDARLKLREELRVTD